MERRDYLLTQIQQLARFIRLLIEKLMGKSSLNIEEVMSQKQEEFQENCGFNISLLTAPAFDELREALTTKDSYTSENIQLLADYMVLLAEKSEDSPLTIIYRLKLNALKLYQLIEVSEKTYSLDRQTKIAGLKRDLELDYLE